MEREIALSIRGFAEFILRSGSIDSRFSGLDRAGQGSRIHRKLQKEAGPGYKAEVALQLVAEQGGIRYTLTGRADGVIEEDGGVTVDEIKTTVELLDAMSEDAHPEHWGQGKIYAHILCAQKGYEAATVQLTYYNVDDDTTRRIRRSYTAKELAAFVSELLREYHRWAVLTLEWKGVRNESLQGLSFPFGGYREGQRDLAIASYNTFKNSGRLFASAPTGIGKTISTLFPALKAMGEGYGERIFYLTAKTITRKTAEETVALMREGNEGLKLLSITLTAKDKICFLEERSCTPENCPYANGYYDRINDAVYTILQSGVPFSREAIEGWAKKNLLCPYELSLDLSSWCDVITCDYNYLFDPVVHLQRFFEGNGGDYLFLVDEAHNLVDRSREMWSAQLAKGGFFALKKGLPKSYTRMHRALSMVNKAFIELRHMCEEEDTDVLQLEKAPLSMEKPLERFVAATEAFLEAERGSEWENEILQLYFDTLFYQRIIQVYDETYVTLVYKRGGEVTAKLLCLDPAHFLDESMALGRGAVLFSATLQPLRYYRETLGGGDSAKLLQLESPFDPARMGLFVADRVSTKYADRERSLDEVCGLIRAMAEAKQGNYIAYFPSYAYMRTVHERFCALWPEIETLEQTGGMAEEEREAFLARFDEKGGETLVGFCVLGGIFGEGVDLAGDRLIGAAIVGVGLPQLGPEPDALRRYYDEKNGCGFEFAYQFPGMNKVLQAAGRVIRGDGDAGVVLLIDDRFTSRRYQELFPAHWRHWQAANTRSLPGQLQDFWRGLE